MLVAVRTGIFGGTFDPIHIAHLHTAECALHQLELDRVLVIPAGDPWQKSDRSLTPAVHRLEMCRLALDATDRITVDDREIVRDGPTYTIDTLQSFSPDDELYLVVGSDAAAGLHTWHRSEEVLRRVTLAIANRPGTSVPDIPDAVDIDIPLLEVSGTDIRVRARSGRPFRFLVMPPVYEYIGEHNLYAEVG